MARDFAMREVLPVANVLDPEHGLIPDSLREKMGDLGFFGILVPEELGGLGLGVVEYAIITEELSRAWMSVASIITRSGIAKALDPTMRAELLPKAARGEWLGAFAMSEPGAGSDIASIRTRADKVDGGWLINGQKMWCTFADQANGIIVVARTTPYDPENRHEGIRRFILHKEPNSFPEGLSGTPVRKIGYHGWNTFELSFDNCFVPDDCLLGYESDGQGDGGFKRVAAGMLTPRIHTAARSIGLARGALEDTIKYVQEREQFGHAIGDYQNTRFKIAEMAADIELCRALMYEVAADVDAGEASDVRAAMLKYAAAEMSERVTSQALQLHGGAGYTTDFPVERYWRDARLTKIFEGSSEIMLRLVSDRLLPQTPFR